MVLAVSDFSKENSFRPLIVYAAFRPALTKTSLNVYAKIAVKRSRTKIQLRISALSAHTKRSDPITVNEGTRV
jgi:hypothetical protein